MKLFAFSVYDVKADIYNVPFFAPTVGVALRNFGDLAKDPQSFISRHPQDYKLVEVGEYDDQVGLLTPMTHIGLGFAADYLEPSAEVSKLREVLNG